MKILNKVNEGFYSYFDKDTTMLFTLKKDGRGIYGAGEAWYLSVTYDGAKQAIATFSTKDDNHKTYKRDYMGKLWDDRSATESADAMVRRMLGR